MFSSRRLVLTLSRRAPLSRKQVLLVGGAATVCLVLSLGPSSSDCASAAPPVDAKATKAGGTKPKILGGAGDDAGSGGSNDDAVAKAIKVAGPIVAKLGLGGVLGYCAGASAKYYGKKAAIFIGGTFAGLQYLSYKGYLKIDYGAVEREIVRKLDLNADGKLDISDFLIMWQEVKGVLIHGLPGAAGFVPGLLLGFRSD